MSPCFQAAVIVEGQMAERGRVSMRTEGRAGEGLRAGSMASMRTEGRDGEGLRAGRMVSMRIEGDAEEGL